MGHAKPICPTCDYEIVFNTGRCPFCRREFHDLCLTARGCQRAACARAYENPPEQFYERRTMIASLVTALTLGAVASGMLDRPAGESPLLNRALVLAMGTAALVTLILQRWRSAQLKPWGSNAAAFVTRWSSRLCFLAAVAVVKPFPAPAYDLIVAAALGVAAISVLSLLSRFSRIAGVLSLCVLGQVYLMVHFTTTPRVDDLAGSARELYRALCRALPAMPSTGTSPIAKEPPQAEPGKESDLQRQTKYLMKEYKTYERVRGNIESQVLRPRR